MKMRIVAFLAACTLAAGGALACDDHHGVCEVEDWSATYSTTFMESIRIEGVVTCDAGRIMLRLYDGEGESRKFIGVESAHIEGHIFTAVKAGVAKPTALRIKYSIEPRKKP